VNDGTDRELNVGIVMPIALGRSLLLGFVILLALAVARQPQALVRLAAPPGIPAAGHAFQIVENGHARDVPLEEIEALGLCRLTTSSPWENGTFTFDGVPFAALVRHFGWDGHEGVQIRAIDGYTRIIPRHEWERDFAILATRDNGRPLDRRQKGPTRIVYPLIEHPELDTFDRKTMWVWMIERMEPVRFLGSADR